MMDLGTFSVSLNVKDLQTARAFYEKLGFTVTDGDAAKNWLMMENGAAKIGLFQGMFDKNVITFNPLDVRDIQEHLKAAGVSLTEEAAEGTDATHLSLIDPDGNPILMDQHGATRKPSPGKAAWMDLTVPDAENVRDFYKAVLGWESEGVSMGEYEDYNMLRDGKAVSGICHQRGMNANIPAQWMVYFTVPDIAESVTKVQAVGGKVVEIRRDDDARPYLAYIQDPAGAIFALFQG